jgi:hypothetical protein
MDFNYAVIIMEQEDPTICPNCLTTRTEDCENLVVGNKDLKNFKTHNLNPQNSFILKCYQAFEINRALENNLQEFKIKNNEFKIENYNLKKKINNLWKNVY